jgi:transcriptional regulator with XRE-family HTH domain
MKLKQVRLEKGFTQERLADKANVTRMTISNIEKGRHVPTVKTLIRLADALGVEITELI